MKKLIIILLLSLFISCASDLPFLTRTVCMKGYKYYLYEGGLSPIFYEDENGNLKIVKCEE